MVAVNCALAWLLREPTRRQAWLGAVGVLLLSVGHLGYGVWREAQPLDQRETQLQVALVPITSSYSVGCTCLCVRI